MAKKKIRLFTSMGKKDSIGSPKGIQKRIDAMGNQAPSMADLSIPINISAKRIAQSVKTKKQLKGSKKELAQSARKILGSVNKGKQLIANARKSVKIPVKNMKKSMALEKPSTASKVRSVGLKILKKGLGPIGELYEAYHTVPQMLEGNKKVGKAQNKKFTKLRRRGRAKHASKIINSIKK